MAHLTGLHRPRSSASGVVLRRSAAVVAAIYSTLFLATAFVPTDPVDPVLRWVAWGGVMMLSALVYGLGMGLQRRSRRVTYDR